MTPSPPPRVRYHLLLNRADGVQQPEVLDAEDVIAWVRGFAAALHQSRHLDVIDPHAPEDTRRVQALQIGDAQGWFTYRYPEFPDRAES